MEWEYRLDVLNRPLADEFLVFRLYVIYCRGRDQTVHGKTLTPFHQEYNNVYICNHISMQPILASSRYRRQMSRWSAFFWRIENHPRDPPRGNGLKMQVALSSRIFFSGFEARRATNRKEDAFGGVRCRPRMLRGLGTPDGDRSQARTLNWRSSCCSSTASNSRCCLSVKVVDKVAKS
jgi:hypothetical protein